MTAVRHATIISHRLALRLSSDGLCLSFFKTAGVEIRCIVIAQHKCFSPNASDVS